MNWINGLIYKQIQFKETYLRIQSKNVNSIHLCSLNIVRGLYIDSWSYHKQTCKGCRMALDKYLPIPESVMTTKQKIWINECFYIEINLSHQ